MTALLGDGSARVPKGSDPGGHRDPRWAQGPEVWPLAPLSPVPWQMWQGIDIETKMHVRFLNVDTIAHCY